jgi:hypothetical protein
LGCGTFLLTNLTPGLEELFEVGRHLVTYEGREDLDTQISYYLAQAPEREAIARAGYAHAQAHHTYLQRARQIAATLGLATGASLAPAEPQADFAPSSVARTQPAPTQRHPGSLSAREQVRCGLWLGYRCGLDQPAATEAPNEFGGSGIEKPLHDWVVRHLPPGRTILELGSGQGSTKHLSRFYQMVSVEDKTQFLGLYDSHYIHAPIVGGWYSLEALQAQLPRQYDLLLVDGPTGEGNRWGFLHHLDLFRTDVPIIFDDTWRQAERDLSQQVAQVTGKRVVPVPGQNSFTVLI